MNESLKQIEVIDGKAYHKVEVDVEGLKQELQDIEGETAAYNERQNARINEINAVLSEVDVKVASYEKALGLQAIELK